MEFIKCGENLQKAQSKILSLGLTRAAPETVFFTAITKKA